MIIAIDHGNSFIKTVSCQFPSSYAKDPAMYEMAEDWILYEDSYYTLTFNRLPYRYDKTKDDNYYILTLFAIAKEVEKCGIYQPNLEIELAVGLPPAYFKNNKDAFAEYLVRGQKEVDFTHNGKEYHIKITKALVFPQAYGAIVNCFEEVMKMPLVLVVDIGGYTVDTLVLKNGTLDMSYCKSYSEGIIKMYGDINDVLNSEFGSTLDEGSIDKALDGSFDSLPQTVIDTIKQCAENRSDRILKLLGEKINGFSLMPVYFTGGGAQLLKPYLMKSGKVSNAKFIESQSANAEGYFTMANALQNSVKRA